MTEKEREFLGDEDSFELWDILSREYPEYISAIQEHKYARCEIDPSFLGFVSTYKLLAQIIPLGRIVYDFGCCNAAQAWYFREHKGYVGIDPSDYPRLQTPNATYHRMTAQDYLLGGSFDFRIRWRAEKRSGFAIMNYVPSEKATEAVKAAFQDVFVFYPRRGDRDDDFPALKVKSPSA